MALVVEDGNGVAGANTYCTRAEATTYHAERGNAAWAAATDDAKDRALLRATEFLDASYRWRGAIFLQTQGLAWPRRRYQTEGTLGSVSAYEYLIDGDGRLLTGLPTAVKRATAELALLALNAAYAEGFIGGTTGASSVMAQGAQRRVKAGSVEVEWFGASAGLTVRQAQDSGLLPNGAGEFIDRLLSGLFIPQGAGRVRLAKA